MSQPVAVCLGECMIELTGTGLADIGASPAGFGGDTLNTAAYLAATLGNAGVTRFVTAVGDDALSESLIAAWDHLGIDTSGVNRLAGLLPGVYLIETDDAGERRFHYWRRDSAASKMASPKNISQLLASLRDADLVYLSGITLGILPEADRRALTDALLQMSADGVRIAFDLNYRPALWSADDALAAVERLGPAMNIALPSVEDDEQLRAESTVATLDFWENIGAREIVVKRGAEGVDIKSDGELSTVATQEIGKPVDTTAAGDSFNAAYLGARLLGKSPVDAALAGHTLASKVIMQPGAISKELIGSDD